MCVWRLRFTSKVPIVRVKYYVQIFAALNASNSLLSK